MIELYPEIRSAHIWTIAISGLWMAFRGIGLLAGRKWPRHILAWSLEWVIVASLVSAGVLLFTLLPREVFANHWLTVKLLFVGLYLLLGYGALLTVRGRLVQVALLGAALFCYMAAFSIARAHDPLGWFSGMIS